MSRIVATIFFILLLTACIAGPWLAPYPLEWYDLRVLNSLPTFSHWLGTDESGRDVWTRLLWGARVSLGIGIVVTFLCASTGTLIGCIAGYAGGWTERAFLVVADVLQAFPGFLLAVALAAFLPPGIGNVIFLLTVVGWVGYARMTRAQVLMLKEREYVQAQQALGSPTWRIFVFHLLPNMAGPLLVQTTFGMAGVILVESTLSFLGLGIPVTVPSWGRMLEGGSQLLLTAPHVSIFPGMAIMIAVLTFNMLGDGLRDKLARR